MSASHAQKKSPTSNNNNMNITDYNNSDSDNDNTTEPNNENNYNYNNTPSTKRKLELSTDLSFAKCKKQMETNGHTDTQSLLQTQHTNSPSLVLPSPSTEEETRLVVDGTVSYAEKERETSAHPADLKLHDSTKLLLDDNTKLLDYANALLASEDIKLNVCDVESKHEGVKADNNNNENKEPTEMFGIYSTGSRLVADGADWRMSDNEDEDDYEDEDEEYDEDENQETRNGHGYASKLLRDVYALSHLSSLRDSTDSDQLDIPLSQDMICSVGISAHEWEKESDNNSVEEKEVEFNPYTFIKNLPLRSSALSYSSPILLPPALPTEHRYTLVLDLDETLVHCSTESLAQPDLVFPVTFNSVEYTVYARKRPYIQEFLSRVSSLFEVVVFTASQEVYADKLLNILDPDRKFIKHRLFRDSCVCVEGNYLKDLTALGRDLSKVIIVDNSPQAFGYHIDNGIPIESWFDDEADTELLSVSTFLESLLTSEDVRPLIREKYKLHELISRA